MKKFLPNYKKNALFNTGSIKYFVFRWFSVIILIVLVFFVALIEVYLVGHKGFSLSLLLRAGMYIFLFLIFLSYGKWIPYAFGKLLDSDQFRYLFKLSSTIKKGDNPYITKVEGYFNLKRIVLIALGIAVVIFVIMFFHFGICTDFKFRRIDNNDIYIDSNKRSFLFFQVLLLSFLFFILSYTVAIICLFVVVIFYSIIKIDKKGPKLKLSYGALKSESFDSLGDFLISIMIPIILTTAALGIMGLIQIFVFKQIFEGTALVIIGFLMALILSLFLYFSARHIHILIKNKKFQLKKDLLKKIETAYNSMQSKESENADEPKQFLVIKNMHDYYYEIENIKEWPFNPSTFKAILTYLGSSVVPVILSLFGL